MLCMAVALEPEQPVAVLRMCIFAIGVRVSVENPWLLRNQADVIAAL